MITNGALFSPDHKYRYALWRIWGKNPLVTWYMLNPSTADEVKDDPTIRRCVGFAERWDKGGIVVLNLFNLISPSPDVLSKSGDPFGDPIKYQAEIAKLPASDLIVCGWGSLVPAKLNWFVDTFHRNFSGTQLFCLGMNQDGNPKHPLYLRADTEPIKYERRNYD